MCEGCHDRAMETQQIHIRELQKMVDHFRTKSDQLNDAAYAAAKGWDTAIHETNDLIYRIKDICTNESDPAHVRLQVLREIRDYSNHLALNPSGHV